MNRHGTSSSERTIPRLTLVKKIIAGYSAMAFFTVAALAFATYGLFSLHRTAREIAKTDLVFINESQRLRESIVAQERYAGKYLILGSNEFKELFTKREDEFIGILASMQRKKSLPELTTLVSNYAQYRRLANAVFMGESKSPVALQASAARVISSIDMLSTNEQVRLNTKLESADQRQQWTVSWTLILSFTGFLLATAVATYVTFSISTAIRKLKKATHRIAEGEFDYDPQIPPGDEIGDLARDFTHMAARLKELEQMSLDASPLTRLPGNIAIERVLNKRLLSCLPFAVCYVDLDNFKAYNDRYGYIKGSELIKMSGEIIYEETTRLAGDDAFVGHVGGDDFVIVLEAENAEEVCKAVTARFDRDIVVHYTQEDVARGAIEGVDRYGVHRTFPIMTVSIAVLICQHGDEYDSAVEIARTAAQIKDHVKVLPGSNYFINRRKGKR